MITLVRIDTFFRRLRFSNMVKIFSTGTLFGKLAISKL
jgi:hypothetical protein